MGNKSMLAVFIFGVLLLSLSAFAATQDLINVQGKAVNKTTGTLITTGNVTVRIYDVPANGTAVHTETFTNVITNGTFSVQVGNSTQLNLTYNDIYWMEIDVNDEEVVGNATSSGRRSFKSYIGPNETAFFVNDTAKYVGINTTSPDGVLHVVAGGTDPALYVNSTTGNVGIGTTAPGQKLAVSGVVGVADGSAGAPAYTFSSDTDLGLYTSGGKLYVATGGTQVAAFHDGTYAFETPAGRAIKSGADFELITGNWIGLGASSERLEFDSTNGIGIMGGNVGIGTTNPLTILELNSTTPTLSFNNGTGTRIIFTGNASGDVVINSTTTANILAIDESTGNVGIGTAGPITKLHIQDTVNTTIGGAGAGQLFTFDNLGTGDNYFMNSVKDSNAGDPGMLFLIQGVGGWLAGVDNSDSDKFKFSSTWSDLAGGAKVTFTTDGNVGIGTTGPNAKLEVAGGGSGLNLNISNDLFVNDSTGNVGIGTTGPNAKLEINASGAAFDVQNTTGSSKFFVNTTSGNVGIGTATPSQTFVAVGTGNFTSTLWVGDTITGINGLTISAGSVSLPASSISQNTIDGITIPYTNLTGTITLAVGNVSNLDYNVLVNQTNITDGISGIPQANLTGLTIPAANISSGTFASGDSTFQDNIIIQDNLTVDTNTLFVDATNGRVGIGLTGPTHTLTVVGTADTNILNITDGTRTLGFYVGTLLGGQSGVSLGAFDENPLHLYTNNTDKLTILANGSVGIGTTSPLTLLEVNATAPTFSFNNGTGTRIIFTGNASGDVVINSTTVANILSIDESTGNIGIGTATPSKDLDVVGETELTGNTTYEIPSGDGKVCFERHVGTQMNYTRCVNATGHVTETIGTFVI